MSTEDMEERGRGRLWGPCRAQILWHVPPPSSPWTGKPHGWGQELLAGSSCRAEGHARWWACQLSQERLRQEGEPSRTAALGGALPNWNRHKSLVWSLLDGRREGIWLTGGVGTRGPLSSSYLPTSLEVFQPFSSILSTRGFA